MANFDLFMGTVTAGDTDGTSVSPGTGTNPLIIGPLSCTANEESPPTKLAMRCGTGYKTTMNTTIALVGGSASKWCLALDNAGVPGTWSVAGGSIVITNTITDVNQLFWIKAKATSDEAPGADASVDIQVSTDIAPV